MGYSGYFPYDSKQEAFLVQLFSLTKFTKHPGFVPAPRQSAGKRGIVKTPPGHSRVFLSCGLCKEGCGSSPVMMGKEKGELSRLWGKVLNQGL